MIPKSKIEVSSYIDFYKDFFNENRHIYDYFCDIYGNEYILGYHCARILNKNDYYEFGINNDGGNDSVQENRIINLLNNCDFDTVTINEIMNRVHANWNNNIQTKTKPVSFYL